MNCDRPAFSGHALRRMFERGIATADVAAAVESGEIIMQYPDDRPLPSALLPGYAEGKPLHVVLARDATGTCQIITVYHPDPAIWNDDFKTRR